MIIKSEKKLRGEKFFRGIENFPLILENSASTSKAVAGSELHCK
jgi:hypothetical protein